MVSYFEELMALAQAELSKPLTAEKVFNAFKACSKKICKSAIVYRFRKVNP